MKQPYQYTDLPLLKRFINEQFDLPVLFRVRVLDRALKCDYVTIAHRLSEYFGLGNIFVAGEVIGRIVDQCEGY